MLRRADWEMCLAFARRAHLYWPQNGRRKERRTMLRVSWLDVKLGLRMFREVSGPVGCHRRGHGRRDRDRRRLRRRIRHDAQFQLALQRGKPRCRDPHPRARRAPGLGAGASMHDFEEWRRELKSIGDLGASGRTAGTSSPKTARRTLIDVASITACGLPFTGDAPLLGRTLLPEDERAMAPPVLVIAYDEWQRRFNGDAGIFGRRRTAGRRHTLSSG